MSIYDEIIALAESNKYDLGMTPEEIQARDILIRAVMEHTPELALDIAKGPYRMNGGGVGQTATPVEAWSRGTNDTSVSDRLRGVPQNPSPPAAPPATGGGPILGTIDQWRNGNPGTSASGPVVPGQAGQGGLQSWMLPPSAPPRAPATNQPQASTGAPPINVNVNLGPDPGQPMTSKERYRAHMAQPPGPPLNLGGPRYNFPPRSIPMLGGMATGPQSPTAGGSMPPWMMPPQGPPPSGLTGGMATPPQQPMVSGGTGGPRPVTIVGMDGQVKMYNPRTGQWE